MQRFRNILVIHNNNVGDEATLARAADLALRNRARLTVAELLEGGGAGELDLVVEQRRFSLERLAASIRRDGLRTRTRVLTGDPFLEITRTVVREGHDLVMMTAEGRTGLRKMLFGTTSLHLMRKCPCPVWVTQGRPDHYSGILAAIDPTGNDDRLNRTIIELASSLARSEGSKLHVVHAWEIEGSDRQTLGSEISSDTTERLIRKHEAPHRARVEALLGDYDLTGLPVELHLPRGRPGWVVPELALEHGIELIVMGTVCRTGVQGLFIGNTAETVLQQVDCAVLTVKPPGFVTPVVDDAGLPVRPARAS